MKTEIMTGLPEEYLSLIKEAKELEFKDTVNSKKKYLEAAKFLLCSSVEDETLKAEYKKEAERIYAIYCDLKRKYGKPIALQVHKMQATDNLGSSAISHKSNYDLYANNSRKITLGSVCGLKELKEEIMLKILLPLKNPEIIQKYKKNGKSGILMYGPPGCGKSMIAEAIANEVGASFFNIKPSDLKSKWVGESEKNIALLFEKAKASQPAIIFIDEFESIGRERSDSTQSFEKDFVSQFLTEMDGLGTKSNNIIVIAATNHPWEIDSAMLRSGRLGTRLFISPPDKDARKELFKNSLRGRPIEDGLDINELGEITEGFSGADIVQLCDAAAEEAIKHYIKTQKQRKITFDDFMTALKKVKPVTASWFRNAQKCIHGMKLEEEYLELLDYQNNPDKK